MSLANNTPGQDPVVNQSSVRQNRFIANNRLEEERFKVDAAARTSRYKDFQTFSGADIKAVMYLPLLTRSSVAGIDTKKIKVFADLQTMSISSTRSVSPVRVFGRSSPIGYTRGARTFAGSLVFATIRKDPFIDVADVGIAEQYVESSTSLVADQLPPFSVVITAVNETGAGAVQIVHGITLTNYGTTYSIDDMYTETTYTYVATDVHVLTPEELRRGPTKSEKESIFFKTITDLVGESMATAYFAKTGGNLSNILHGTVSSIPWQAQKLVGRTLNSLPGGF